jgi:hypothetical protein
MKTNMLIALLIICFASLGIAQLTCLGDSAPNMLSNLIISCTTKASSSACKVEIYDNSSRPIGYYPSTCFGEDKICINTFPDGSFPISIYMSPTTYNSMSNYSVNISCSDAADNSVNTTIFNFSPTTAGGVVATTNEILRWLGNNAAAIIVICFVLVPFILFVIGVLSGVIHISL